jgi:hypothetical protein
MTANLQFLTLTLAIMLASCSTQEVKNNDITNAKEAKNKSTTPENERTQSSGQNPAMTIMRNGLKLSLVRIMDGGICKNEFQGVKGAFLLYADTKDIDRIKQEKGIAIFNTFETKIQAISEHALQEAINETNLSEDPFSLGEDQAQQKLASQLVTQFSNKISKDLDSFDKETSLTIDISPFPPSLVFYQKGCETSTINPEDSESKT